MSHAHVPRGRTPADLGAATSDFLRASVHSDPCRTTLGRQPAHGRRQTTTPPHGHLPTHESRPGIRIARGLPIRSLRLGIVGQADVVEFRTPANDNDKTTIVPIEYKRGQPKKDDSDRVQLCAQALCLEEMCDTHVTEGALFMASENAEPPSNSTNHSAGGRSGRSIVFARSSPNTKHHRQSKCPNARPVPSSNSACPMRLAAATRSHDSWPAGSPATRLRRSTNR